MSDRGDGSDGDSGDDDQRRPSDERTVGVDDAEGADDGDGADASDGADGDDADDLRDRSATDRRGEPFADRGAIRRGADEGRPAAGRSAADERPLDEPEDTIVFTFLLPFLGAVLLALGIAGSVVGGWAMVQPAIDGCGNPTIGVESPAETAELLERSDEAAIERIAIEDLSEAERRAVAEAIESVRNEGTVEGDFPNRGAFERGVVIVDDGTERYATLVSMNRCTSIDPLVFPLAFTAMLLGMGVFALMWVRNTEWAGYRPWAGE